MNANEARIAANQVRIQQVKAQYESIMRAVDVAVKAGKFSTSYDGTILPENRRRLKEEGYQIKTGKRPVDTEDENNITW